MTSEHANDGEEVDRNRKIGMLQAWKDWPKSVFCIVGNEFCERFNYYGMRAVLFLYLLRLGFDSDTSTGLYHGFSVLAYFSPILGAILADGFVGKFHVILWVSLLYAFGSILLAIASMLTNPNIHPYLDLTGLFIIGLGTGGIKPCVAPFGADQFKKGQENLIEPYFSFFYAAINCGSLLSIVLSPMMQVQRCMGQDTCYPLAFGIPAILMILAVLLFVAGNVFGYRKMPPKENIFAEVFRAIYTALKNKSNFDIKRDHWMDHYMDNHTCKYDDRCTEKKCHKAQFVDDIKGLFRVLIMYLPIPFFWTLFDQQGSRWMIQSIEMKYSIGDWMMPPSLVQAINPILILAFIPLFQGVVYPLIRKCGIEPTPLRRMVVGGILAALAFVIAGLVQMEVDKTLPTLPKDGLGQANVINVLPCEVSITNMDAKPNTYTLKANGTISGLDDYYLLNQTPGKYNWTITALDDKCSGMKIPSYVEMSVVADKVTYTIIAPSSLQPTDENDSTSYEGTLEKDDQGLGLFTVSVFDYRKEYDGGDQILLLCSDGKKEDAKTGMMCNPQDPYNFEQIDFDAGHYRQGVFYANNKNSTLGAILPGIWKIYKYNGTDWPPLFHDPKWTTAYMMQNVQDLNVEFTIWGQGAVYALTLYTNETKTEFNAYQAVSANTFPVLWQVPQYAIITAAEICMSITGLEFSYSQSAQSMKSLLQAAWLLTISIGDSIIIVIADVEFFPDLAMELFFFAGLMIVVTFIFMLMSVFYYEYKYYEQVDDDDSITGDMEKPDTIQLGEIEKVGIDKI